MSKKRKFVQIAGTQHGIYALDAAGNVWTYGTEKMFTEKGWELVCLWIPLTAERAAL
jgi:alpha-tubulin suppressor-like RCC1 family protein